MNIKISNILEGLNKINEVDSEAVNPNSEVEKGKILFCIDVSSPTNAAIIAGYQTSIVNLIEANKDSKFNAAIFSSDGGVIVKRNITKEFTIKNYAKNSGGNSDFDSLLNTMDFKKFDKIYIFSIGEFKSVISDDSLKILKKYKSRINWIIPKKGSSKASLLKLYTDSKIEILENLQD